MKWKVLTISAAIAGFACGRLLCRSGVATAEKPKVLFTLSPSFGSVGVAVMPSHKAIEAPWIDYYELDLNMAPQGFVNVTRWDRDGNFSTESATLNRYEIPRDLRLIIEKRTVPPPD